MIKYIDFYKNFGIRRPDQLMRPPLPSVLRMQLPRQSLVHYMPTSPAEMGPNEDYFLFRKNNQPFRIDHVYWLEAHQGNPRRLPENPDLRIRDWRRDHQRFKPIADLAMALRTPDAIVVANYSVLPHNYTYPPSLYREYFRSSNFIYTLFKRMARYSGKNYNQFMELRLPKVLPSVKLLDKAQVNPAPAIANLFSSFEMRFLLQLWRWLGPHRLKFEESALMSQVADEVNLIFREGDRFCCLNMGFLEKQRKATRAEVLAWEEAVRASMGSKALEALSDEGSSKFSEKEIATFNQALEVMAEDKPILKKPNLQGADPVSIQKRFLRIAMGVLDARNPEVDERLDGQIVEDTSKIDADPEMSASDTSLVVDDDEASDDNPVVQQGMTSEPVNISESSMPLQSTSSNSMILELDEAAQQLIELDLDTLAEMANDLDVEEENPNTISESTIAGPQVTGVEDELTPQDRKALEKDATSGLLAPSDVVGNFNRLLARASADGNLSASDYLSLRNVAEKVRSIDIGGTTLDKYVQIQPDELAIVEQASIPDRDTIVDKSMLKSTLIDYRENYTKKIMKRDVASMVTNVMNAGYAIQDFQAVPVEDVGGKRTEYAVKIKPIEGQATTIRFTIPDVDGEGVFRINNVAYTTRAQRGDIPVRVVSPTRVSLTSYYGKVFVDRCERRVADYGKWIRRNIMAIALSESNKQITEAAVGNAFENTGEGVRDYTTIAQGFRSFNFLVDGRKFACNFAASSIPQRFSKESIAWAKKNKATLVGLAGDGTVLTADVMGQWYVVSEDGATKPVGTLEEILGLNSAKAPVEFAELKVFGKMIPLGIVLGYMMGMRTLLAKLRIKPRVVPSGTRPTMAPDEFRVIFADEAWIFDRKDPMARMVFGGLIEYGEALSRYNADEFDRKDVYFNVLESKKLGMRYLREMELLEQLFVDPITRELLIFYKEPVVFRELLLRAAQLLTTDQHPSEVDGNYMREKGYERFAGILYDEIIKAVRQHQGRPGKERFGLEMKNYAVFQAIQQDPAKDQVSEINPIQNLKEQEAVTFSGVGGRGSRTMVKRTRVFTESDEGVISEQTVDSSDVAVNVYTTANPQYANLRGIKRKFDIKRDGVTALLSTSALISPGSTRDD